MANRNRPSSVDTLRRRIRRQELDRTFAQEPDLRIRLEPAPGGWVRDIRTALGMTARQLGKRVGISQSSMTLAEAAEADSRITLKTLRKIAEGLNCDVVYALVPRTSLETMVHNQANRLAHRMVEEVRHGMALEKQSTHADDRDREISDLRARLIARGSARIWDAPAPR